MNTQATSFESVKATAPSTALRNPTGAAFQDVLSQVPQPAAQTATAAPLTADAGQAASAPPKPGLPQASNDAAPLSDAALGSAVVDPSGLAGAGKTKAQSKDPAVKSASGNPAGSKAAALEQAPAAAIVPAVTLSSPPPQAVPACIAAVAAGNAHTPVHGPGASKSEASPVGEAAGPQPGRVGVAGASVANAAEGGGGPDRATLPVSAQAGTVPTGSNASVPAHGGAGVGAAGVADAGVADGKTLRVEMPAAAATVTAAVAASVNLAPRPAAGADAPTINLPAGALDFSVIASAQAGLTTAAVPVTTAAAAAASTAGASPAAQARPAAQLAPAMVQMSGTAGSNHLTIRLNPGELGSVSVSIDRAGGGPATVAVTVERPETLRMLQNDQPELQRALDAAGLPQEGRTLTLSLALPDQSSASGAAPSFTPSGGFGSSGSGGSSTGGSHTSSGGSSGGNAGGGSGGQQGRPDPRYGQSGGYQPGSSPSWLRAGVDITA